MHEIQAGTRARQAIPGTSQSHRRRGLTFSPHSDHANVRGQFFLELTTGFSAAC